MRIADILADLAYPVLKQRILHDTGLDYYADKDEDLGARLLRRFTARNVATCTAYMELLAERGVPSEYDLLIGELTIGETYFFRQAEHFNLLRDRIIPDILNRNAASRRMRVWSAGCATGAEPYSVAIVLRREFGTLLSDWNVEILGTDINPSFLERARMAHFSAWALRETPDEIRKCCFALNGETKMWRLLRPYAAGVTFQRHNLVSSTFFPGQHGDSFDLILCRNVLIYFSPQRVRALVERLYGSLAPGGWLLVGHAEASNPELRSFQADHSHGVTVYRRGAESIAGPESPWLPAALPEIAIRSPGNATAHHNDARPAGPAAPPKEGLSEARVLAGRGEWAQAERICRRVISADPLCAAGHFTLGLILEQTSARDAEAAFRKSIYLDRHFALGHYHLGCCLERAGKAGIARKSFQNVLTVLAGSSGDEFVTEGEGMTVAELRELTRMHLELLESR